MYYGLGEFAKSLWLLFRNIQILQFAQNILLIIVKDLQTNFAWDMVLKWQWYAITQIILILLNRWRRQQFVPGTPIKIISLFMYFTLDLRLNICI